MKNVYENIRNLYLKGEYLKKHPSLNVEDSPWKFSKIVPLVDRFIKYVNKNEINLLDVGGGGGIILNAVSAYIERSFGVKINKFALDISPEMLKIQKKNNPDLQIALNADVCRAPLGYKVIDLTLMIDVLEHVPNPIEALQEIKRVSNFVIFKVPLEDSILFNIFNLLMRKKARQYSLETYGHISFYNFKKFKYQIEKYNGRVLDYFFTNAFARPRYKMKVRSKLKNSIGSYVFKLSPYLCSLVLRDYAMILVKCYK